MSLNLKPKKYSNSVSTDHIDSSLPKHEAQYTPQELAKIRLNQIRYDNRGSGGDYAPSTKLEIKKLQLIIKGK